MHLKHKMAAAIVAVLAMAAASTVDAVPRTPMKAGHTANQGLVASPPDCDPFSDWDGDSGSSGSGSDDSTTNGLLPGPSRPSTHGRYATSAAAQVIGTTPEAIQRNFMGVVTRNLGNAGTATRVSRLSDKELHAIARHAAQGTPAERAALLKLFAMRLDARALVRIARAFGRAPTEAAVEAYADRPTRAAFERDVAGLMAPDPDEGGGGGGGGTTTPYPSPSPPRPTVDMTLEEIYLEYRTAPVGSLSPAGALAETAQFAGVRLSAAYGAGYAVGTVISWLIGTYAPDLDDTIGSTIATMIDNFWEASGEVQQGHFEAAFDQLFGFPVTNSSDPWGDWDIDTPMVEYYGLTGTCGY
jgi:hypothetical protein